MRIGGLASGMDTEGMIKELMNAQRIPLDKITQKKQYLEWQLDDYRAINRNLNDFSQNLFNNLILSSKLTQKTVNVSAPDDVAIRNVSSSSDFSGTIKVDKLAVNATMQSTGKVIESEADLTTPLKNLKLDNGEELKLPPSFKIKAIQADGTFDEKGYEVVIDEGSTLKSVLDDINKNSGVSAFYDSFKGKIAFTAKHSGVIKGEGGNGGREIEFDATPEVLNFLKIKSDNGAASSDIPTSGTRGENAIFTFNGLETERPSNKFQINGFEVTLKATNDQPINFNSQPDTESVLETVTKFVDDYNKLIEDLHKQIREPKYRDFHPLSTEQKGEMKEKEIELWEEKAKSGTLRNDSMISSMLTKMRTVMMESVGGKHSLNDLGITTSSNYLENGKLIIDEKKLRDAINADPGKIHDLFAMEGEQESDMGIARRLRTIVDDSRKDIAARAGNAGAVNQTFTLGRNLINMDKQIERFEDRLKQVESRYWKQFTAMEMAIQRSNNQYSYLANAFGGGA